MTTCLNSFPAGLWSPCDGDHIWSILGPSASTREGTVWPHQMHVGWLDKGNHTWFWDSSTRTVKERSWPAVGNCSSAIRWLNRYYCFRGNKFLRFDPVKGEVNSSYPRDVRDYFMPCPNRGEKAPALGPLETCPPFLSLQTPYTPAPTLTYGMIPWPLPQPHFHSGSSQLSSYGEDLHPQYSQWFLPPQTSSWPFAFVCSPCLFLPQGHAHRNATQHVDKRCSPHLVLSALLSDNHGAAYAFSGKRCPPIPHLCPPYLPTLPCVPLISETLPPFSSLCPYEQLPSFHPSMLLFTSHSLRCIWSNLSHCPGL